MGFTWNPLGTAKQGALSCPIFLNFRDDESWNKAIDKYHLVFSFYLDNENFVVSTQNSFSSHCGVPIQSGRFQLLENECCFLPGT